jgi:heptosyltransferase-2
MLTAAVSPLPAFVPMRKRSVAEVKQLIHATGPAGVIPTAIPAGAHHIHHYLHLAAALGADPRPRPTCVVVGADEVTAARHRFALNAGVIWVGVNAGAEYGLAKRWPAERFAAVARSVIQSSSRGVVLTGGAADLDLATSIRAELLQAGASPERVVLLAGKTSLRELAAVLAACAGVVTNDTGPMHLAAAVGTPVVAIFGSTEPALTAPGLPGDSRHRLLRSPVSCAPCFLRVCPVDFRCMRGVTTERVVSAVDDLLEPRSSTV